MFQRFFEKNSRFAHFGQKLSKIGHFGPKCPKMEVFGLSTKSLETYGFTSVRASVRPSDTLLLENRSLLFSETLQLVRACKCEKNFPRAFLKKFPFCPFWPKTVQIWSFWPKMSKHGGFSHFLVSRRLADWDLRNHACLSVRPSVRNAISENLHIRIIWNLAVS